MFKKLCCNPVAVGNASSDNTYVKLNIKLLFNHYKGKVVPKKIRVCDGIDFSNIKTSLKLFKLNNEFFPTSGGGGGV